MSEKKAKRVEKANEKRGKQGQLEGASMLVSGYYGNRTS